MRELVAEEKGHQRQRHDPQPGGGDEAEEEGVAAGDRREGGGLFLVCAREVGQEDDRHGVGDEPDALGYPHAHAVDADAGHADEGQDHVLVEAVVQELEDVAQLPLDAEAHLRFQDGPVRPEDGGQVEVAYPQQQQAEDYGCERAIDQMTRTLVVFRPPEKQGRRSGGRP